MCLGTTIFETVTGLCEAVNFRDVGATRRELKRRGFVAKWVIVHFNDRRG